MNSILAQLNNSVLDKNLVSEDLCDEPESYIEVKNEDEILKLVFDDSYIKAEKSPFSIYPDDRRKDLPVENIPDFNRVVQEYRSGTIDERVMNILKIIIDHRYITTRQIWQLYLLLLKKFIKYQHLNKLLKHMSEQGLIAVYETESAKGNAKYHCYCVDYNGARLYSALYGKKFSWKKTDVIQPVYIMKKSFAKNQFLIAFLKHYDFKYELQPRLVWNEKSTTKTVIPTLQMTFQTSDKIGKTILMVEVLRMYQGWKEEYQEKLIRYENYLKSLEDTQKLNKYYLIVCAESEDHVIEAVNVRYALENEQLYSDIRKMNIYYTYDLKLLDHHIEKNLFSDLKGFEYSYDNNEWEEKNFLETFEEHDWHELSFVMENIPTTEKSTKQISEKSDNEKQKYAFQIYKLVIEHGKEFPIEAVKLAPLLNANKFFYTQLGYGSLKELFMDLSEYYQVSYVSPTQMLIECIQNPIEDEKEIHKENDVSCNAIIDYFTYGFVDRKKWTMEFEDDIFWYTKREVTAAFLSKMTKNYDFTMQGWLDIIAFIYYRAKNQKRIFKNNVSEINRICFDTHLLSFEGEKIYLIAKKNYRAKPEWVLEGLSTIHSKLLGEILKKEFKEL